MTLKEWMSESWQRYREDGLLSINESAYEFYIGGLRNIGRWFYEGTPIFKEDWDVLVILDACRYDLMTEVADEYDWIRSCESRTSAGGASFDWMNANFNEQYEDNLSETVYVTGNGFSREHVDPTLFKAVDEVWQYSWDNEEGTIQPRPITDRAITQWRKRNPDQLIVHYMQPHRPFIAWENRPDTGLKLVDGEFEKKGNEFELLQSGEISKEAAWDGYKDTLRLVLDELEVLLENIDEEKIIVSADHGNAFGEWGVYAHLSHAPLSAIREVPWCEVETEYVGDYEPADYNTNVQITDEDVQSRLADLGYI